MLSEKINVLGRVIVPAIASLALAGCALDVEESIDTTESVAEASDSIVDGTAVSSGSSLAKSTVGVWSPQGGGMWSSCTGVIVGWKYVLTAAHCKPTVGGFVLFYNGPLPMSGITRNIIDVDMRAGVNPWNDDLSDANGKFADIAVLTLDGGIPSGTQSAELPLSYPGNNVNGYIVGRGRHDSCNPAWTCIDGQPNSDEDLRYFYSHTYSSDNNDGHFLVDDPNVNKGDSGGPFFTHNSGSGKKKVHGVLYGTTNEWGAHSKYTSIEHHLDWVLDKMAYTGGMLIDQDTARTGSTYEIYWTGSSSYRRCALACAQSMECRSFSSWPGGMCELKDSTPAKTSISGVTSGAKWSI